jgi:hypothetical protein
MNPILSAGLLIGVLCGVWMFVMGFTGWYRDPAMLNLFFVVVLIELGGLYWGLRQTAAQGRGYGQQVIAGTGMAFVAGIIIIGASLLFTTVAFPDYFAELEAIQRQQLAEGGMAQADIDAAIQATAAMSTPIMNALTGFIGTLITGIIGSAIIAAFVKAPARTPGAPARV